MRCLCCRRSITEKATEYEKQICWHKRCVKSFFGTDTLPELDLSKKKLESIASATVNKKFTVPGVQKKMSLHLSKEPECKLTIVDYPTGYILKPQTDDYPCLPEYEALAMEMAKSCGIAIVPNALIKVGDQYAYITKRIDREIGSSLSLYAMEDFCQLSERLTADKYKGSYEACGKIIKKYSSRVGFDMTELFLRIVFSFVIGNSDMHLKNFSLIEDTPGLRKYALSPAYDMLPVNVILPSDKEQMALTLNGKKKNIRKKDFYALSDNLGINQKVAERIIEKVVSMKKEFFKECDSSYIGEEDKERVRALIEARIKIFSH